MTGLMDARSPVGEPRPEDRRGPRRARHPLLTVVLVLVVVVGLLVVATVAVVGRLDRRLDRLPEVFSVVEGGVRPAPATMETFVVVITDSTAPDPNAPPVDRGQPAEVVLVAQFSADAGTVVALRPAGQPEVALGATGAYPNGGPAQLIRAVEDLTDLLVDRFVTVDLAGLPEMVDAIGGIRLPLTDPADPGADLRLQPVDGSQALAYARGEREVADGAAARVHRWTTVMRSLVQGMSQDQLLRPLGLVELLDVVGRTVRTDEGLGTAGLWGLVYRLGGLRSEQVTFLSVPDSAALGDSRELWAAMRTGPVPVDYLTRHPEDKLRWRGPS